MQLSSAIITAILALTCAAAPHPRSAWVQHEKRDATSHQWQRRDRAVPGHVIPIDIALRERNIENTARYVEEVSDPKSPNFGMSLDAKTCPARAFHADSALPGKHWSSEKIANVFSAHDDSKEAVLQWLEESGVDRARVALSTGLRP